jgi:hypothetical protein
MPAWIKQRSSQVAKRGEAKAAWYVYWNAPDGDDRRWRRSFGSGTKGRARAQKKADAMNALLNDGRINDAEVEFGQPESDGHCRDCGTDTTKGRRHQYYSLLNEVWALTGMNCNGGMLCILCVEKRIGRRLQPEGFADVAINRDHPHPVVLDRLAGRFAKTLAMNMDLLKSNS